MGDGREVDSVYETHRGPGLGHGGSFTRPHQVTLAGACVGSSAQGTRAASGVRSRPNGPPQPSAGRHRPLAAARVIAAAASHQARRAQGARTPQARGAAGLGVHARTPPRSPLARWPLQAPFPLWVSVPATPGLWPLGHLLELLGPRFPPPRVSRPCFSSWAGPGSHRPIRSPGERQRGADCPNGWAREAGFLPTPRRLRVPSSRKASDPAGRRAALPERRRPRGASASWSLMYDRRP